MSLAYVDVDGMRLGVCIVFLKKKKKKGMFLNIICIINIILSISFVIFLVNIICIINNVQILIDIFVDIDIDIEYVWVLIYLTSNVFCC